MKEDFVVQRIFSKSPDIRAAMVCKLAECHTDAMKWPLLSAMLEEDDIWVFALMADTVATVFPEVSEAATLMLGVRKEPFDEERFFILLMTFNLYGMKISRTSLTTTLPGRSWFVRLCVAELLIARRFYRTACSLLASVADEVNTNSWEPLRKRLDVVDGCDKYMSKQSVQKLISRLQFNVEKALQ